LPMARTLTGRAEKEIGHYVVMIQTKHTHRARRSKRLLIGLDIPHFGRSTACYFGNHAGSLAGNWA
jgi:hypothetical protein